MISVLLFYRIMCFEQILIGCFSQVLVRAVLPQKEVKPPFFDLYTARIGCFCVCHLGFKAHFYDLKVFVRKARAKVKGNSPRLSNWQQKFFAGNYVHNNLAGA